MSFLKIQTVTKLLALVFIEKTRAAIKPLYRDSLN